VLQALAIIFATAGANNAAIDGETPGDGNRESAWRGSIRPLATADLA